ncbi:MraY family glycosyltransferase [Dictyobacter arantiisoli]|uniref:Undecaprenyl-phosphate alpha-N-acetylglucosaminyl 1-phosphate transferase n=1 Tax=Dictyobacter arantiisoli TaxID=2014874 RepID=A0A5A5THP4_9CHLR|nr:MraY family glycosyltransferase [Dictyobacter arantiisoli]GCF10484.1 undecaprenyl-phosphate alpha-N-acetylglucosaminyl 1-phosphate transferase [Dictyobacter arantiisoli]
MVLARLFPSQPLFFLFSTHMFNQDHPTVNLMLLVAGSVCAFLASYVLLYGVAFVSRKYHLIRQAEPGRTQDKVPRLGGVAIFLAFVISSLIFYINNGDLQAKEKTVYWLFLAAATLIVAVHAYDDVRPLKPLPKLLAQTIAVIIIMGPFLNGQFNGVLLFGFSNPFQSFSSGFVPHGTIVNIFIHSTAIRWLAIPAVLFTWFWMVGMMNTVNLIDGLDGLATGVVAITAIFIASTSWLLNQYTIAVLAGIFAGAVLGFLPHNWNPARMFMGDSGSQFLGLALAVLSIMGGAKIALALMVLGVPIMDVAIVIINRLRRGQHPLHYDRTHLHYRLQSTGLSARQICYIFYGLTILFGCLAMSFGHFFKLIGIALVMVTMAALITWIDARQRRRGLPIKLDKSDVGVAGIAAEQNEQFTETAKTEITTETTLPDKSVSAPDISKEIVHSTPTSGQQSSS